MEEFSFATRKSDLLNLTGRKFQALVVGGGIIGSGIANTLAQCGVSVLLIDKGDFASGTSSGSSKMIHGGLRYLAQGRIRLTGHLLRERNYLLRNTGIVSWKNFTILIGKGMWNRRQLSFGLILYRLLGGGRSSRYVKNGGEFPGNVDGCFTYRDAVTDDALLTMVNVISARDHGATCLNYVKLNAIPGNAGGSYSVIDTITGENFVVGADLVINCAGSWARDLVTFHDKERTRMKLSKGVHLIFPASIFPRKDVIVFRSSVDGRQMFIIPREKVVILGTTDEFTEDPADFAVSEKERDYVLRSVADLFPQFRRESIIGEYAGIRSLYGVGDSPGKMSRDFKLIRSGNTMTVFGGKVTDYRRVSRIVSKVILTELGLRKSVRGLPEIKDNAMKDGITVEQAVYAMCSLCAEDVVRRRTGSIFFDPGSVKSQIGDFENLIRERGLNTVSREGVEYLSLPPL